MPEFGNHHIPPAPDMPAPGRCHGRGGVSHCQPPARDSHPTMANTAAADVCRRVPQLSKAGRGSKRQQNAARKAGRTEDIQDLARKPEPKPAATITKTKAPPKHPAKRNRRWSWPLVRATNQGALTRQQAQNLVRVSTLYCGIDSSGRATMTRSICMVPKGIVLGLFCATSSGLTRQQRRPHTQWAACDDCLPEPEMTFPVAIPHTDHDSVPTPAGGAVSAIDPVCGMTIT